jgi:hypothetical protein
VPLADVLRERTEAEIDKIIAAHVDALGSDDARIRLQAAEALLAAARGPRQLRALPPVLQSRAWTMHLLRRCSWCATPGCAEISDYLLVPPGTGSRDRMIRTTPWSSPPKSLWRAKSLPSSWS